MSRSPRLILEAVAIVFSALSAVPGHAQDLYGCGRPTGMPLAPDGSVATLAEMETARESVEAFLDQGEAFVSCLAQYPNDRVSATIRNQVILEMDLSVVRFNAALCVYTGGADCGRSASGPASPSPWPPAAAGGSEADALAPDLHGLGDASGLYPETAPADPAAGSWLGGDSAFHDSPNASPAWPAGSRSVAQVREPSLPDGTRCGSVRQTRADTSGEGPSLRAYYIWEVHNACIDPIRMRSTFGGDGVLDSTRTIPGRGSQSIGCSTAAGEASSRDCTGGLQYLFEWP